MGFFFRLLMQITIGLVLSLTGVGSIAGAYAQSDSASGFTNAEGRVGGPGEPTVSVQPQVGTAPPPVMAAPMPLGEAMMSAEDQARVEYWGERLPLPGPPLTGGRVVAPPSGSETSLGGRKPLLAQKFRLWSNTDLSTIIPSGFSSSTNEPSTAMAGRNRFQTGNWYAAYSNNRGWTWTHLSPFSAFPSIDGGFCCDQDTLYDPSRGMFIWFLQYIKSGSTSANKGSFRIALWNKHLDNLSNAGWYYYTFDPTMLGGGGGEWFDYPHLALGTNYLYVAINVFTTTTDTWTRTVMIRLPLREMRYAQGFTFNYYSTSSYFNFTPVQGAKETMFWASQVSGTKMALFKWPESTTVSIFTRTITSYSAGGTHNCPAADGNDWCARSDNRILAGVLARSKLWFFWNVRQDSFFPWPYIEGARFDVNGLTYEKRPLLWSSTAPWHYLGAAPNGRGHLAISAAFGHTPNLYPGSVVCLDDDYNGDPAPWECYTTKVGAHGPASNRWGDFLRVRPADPADYNWTATAFTLQSSSATGNAEPRNLIFGRERDAWQYFRWWQR